MGKRYNLVWSKLFEMLEAVDSVVKHYVKVMCRMLEADLGGFLDNLAREYGFTYRFEPVENGGGGVRYVPGLIISGNPGAKKVVEKELYERFPDIMSDSRLRIVAEPVRLSVEEIDKLKGR